MDTTQSAEQAQAEKTAMQARRTLDNLGIEIRALYALGVWPGNDLFREVADTRKRLRDALAICPWALN